jgi:hypothetical protein
MLGVVNDGEHGKIQSLVIHNLTLQTS